MGTELVYSIPITCFNFINNELTGPVSFNLPELNDIALANEAFASVIV